MIFFLAPAGETWGMEEYLSQHGGPLAERVRILTYDDIVAQRTLALGTYIFAAVDRLVPTEREIAEQCCQALTRKDPHLQLLNRPHEVVRRYQLLQTCFERHRNAFRVRRASELWSALKFPVFIRSETEHGGSLTPLLKNRWQLTHALAMALLRGYRLRDLIVVEYCHTADSSGIFRLHCAAIVGDTILPQVLIHNRNWITKWDGRLVDPDKAAEQRTFVETNPHAAWLKETFGLAKIRYGRIDYGLKDGLPQVWEINTNPMIVRRAASPSAMPVSQANLLAPVRDNFLRRLQAALVSIDSEADSGESVRIDISPAQVSRLEVENRLRLRLRAHKTAISDGPKAVASVLRRLGVR